MPEVSRPSLKILQAQTDAEVVDDEPRECDHCHDETLFGHAAFLRVGFEGKGLCLACTLALCESAEKVRDALRAQGIQGAGAVGRG